MSKEVENVTYYEEVKEGLFAKSSLSVEVCLEALNHSLLFYGSPHSTEFLDKFFLRVISVILDQNPTKLGSFERSKVDLAVETSINIILKSLEMEKIDYIDVLLKLFNKSFPLYAGTKTYWSYLPGDPMLRIQTIRMFQDKGGFNILSTLIETQKYFWNGAEKTILLVKALSEIDEGYYMESSKKIIIQIMKNIISLTEDSIKRETTDNWTILIKLLAPHHKSELLLEFQNFWMEFTSKLIQAGSIVLKLFAWETINDMIIEAVSTRIPPKCYLVKNAGTEEVNGIYEAMFSLGEVPKYVKRPSSSNGSIFTLFRCQMRSKQKWWFISIADIEKPGTDKDIDYYQHKSGPDQESEPPLNGWNCLSNNSYGKEPPPVLCRMEPMESNEKKDSFHTLFVKWLAQNSILDHAFGHSMHREILIRSKNLLVFLLEEKRLHLENIRNLWRIGIQNQNEEIYDEIFSLLASLTQYFSDEEYECILSLATETVMMNNDGYMKVALFVDKIYSEGGKYIRSLSENVKVRVAKLLWELFTNPCLENFKNSSTIEQFLSICLQSLQQPQLVLDYIQESTDILKSFTDTVVDEKVANGIVQTLCFLLSQHLPLGSDEDLYIRGFHDTLLEELKRFVSSNRHFLNSSDKDVEWYRGQVSKRLQLLRSAYGLSTRVNISKSALHTIWDLLVSPHEREQVFVFFRLGGVRNHQSESAFDINDCLYVFTNMICSEIVDWSTCGDEAFACFTTYFNGLNRRQDFPRNNALNSLWKIIISIPTESSARSAINLLLKTYEELLHTDSHAHIAVLTQIFKQLGQVSQSLSAPLKINSRHRLEVLRCIELLNESLIRNKNTSKIIIPHGARGQLNRIKLKVRCREINIMSHYQSQLHYRQSYDKTSERIIQIPIHPLHSLFTLKSKIAEETNFSSVRKINIEYRGQYLNGDALPLKSFAICDGAELSVNLVHSSNSTLDDDEISDCYGYNRNFASENVDVASFIASRDNMECLMILLNKLDSQKEFELSLIIWNLIATIPTQPEYQDIIRTNLLNSNSDWSCLRGTNGAVAYFLQILDYFLSPAPEIASLVGNSDSFKESLIQYEGLTLVFNYFVEANFQYEDIIGQSAIHSSLHIIFTCLNNTGCDKIMALMTQSHERVRIVLEKLLTVAHSASETNATEIVQMTLATITVLLGDTTVASQLAANPKAESLLSDVLRSDSKTVRELASQFAVQVGQIQYVVVDWLISELRVMNPSDKNCYQIFEALISMVLYIKRMGAQYDLSTLSEIVLDKVINMSVKDVPEHDQTMISGLLELFNCLLEFSSDLIVPYVNPDALMRKFLCEYLFTLPINGNLVTPICYSSNTRHLIFIAVRQIICLFPDTLSILLSSLVSLSKKSFIQFRFSWGLQASRDMKPTFEYTGLKNQGCTCYLNSLLQQLFMNLKFRQAVMKTPLLAAQRTTLWHVKPEELVGQELLVEWANGEWRSIVVHSFDDSSQLFEVKYKDCNETTYFDLRQGRFGRETGRVKTAAFSALQMTEREQAAIYVLEQLQRTFCFMEKSKQRYFDPKPLIDACKSLNLNFNVYHQNDASEFCDQLLDRLEIAMKGKYTGINTWNDIIQNEVFGGKMVYQKIPKDCEAYESDKTQCGHWKSTREEAFMKVELLIRGKDSIEESLNQHIEGELMDGDNQILCDVCNMKKDTIRRTCFGTMPNSLILHLKRFDLDFSTFETVKLNNRISFPMQLCMVDYTKEGIEFKEGLLVDNNIECKQQKFVLNESKLLHNENYLYDLRGVLVHAGVAQGGHYYSFIKAPDDIKGRWFRFEDDEVTLFDPLLIAQHCFGGPSSNSMDDDRTANALILFYEKLSPSNLTASIEENMPQISSNLINGYVAFSEEVSDSNLKYILSEYLLDAELHIFLQKLLSISFASSEQFKESYLFCLQFYLDCILHIRELPDTQMWTSLFTTVFQSSIPTAIWFLHRLSNSDTYWLRDYFLTCADSNSKQAFMHVVCAAVNTLQDKFDFDELQRIKNFERQILPSEPNSQLTTTTTTSLILFCRNILKLLIDVPRYIRNCEEFFVLIKELALLPIICTYFLEEDIIPKLVYFVTPDRFPEAFKEKYFKSSSVIASSEVANLFPVIIESIASLLGVPQIPKQALLKDKLNKWEPELSEEARLALTTIFEESAPGGCMDARDIQNYMKKVRYDEGSAHNDLTTFQVRTLLDRYDTTFDGKLTLSGFLKYYSDTAVNNSKSVWKDLAVFGYRYDFARFAKESENHDISDLPPLNISQLTIHSLNNFTLYEIGMEVSEASAAATLRRVCFNNNVVSLSIIKHACIKLNRLLKEWHLTTLFEVVMSILKCVMSIDDCCFDARVQELFLSEYGLLMNILEERNRARNYSNSFDQQLFQRYIEVIHILSSVKKVTQWIDYKSTHDGEFVWLKSILQTGVDNRQPKYDKRQTTIACVSENDMPKVSVLVEGAGLGDINGTYSFRCFLQGHNSCFIKQGTFNGQSTVYSLYRCKMQNNGLMWFISIAPRDKEPGSKDDIDFYSHGDVSFSHSDPKLPPQGTWQSVRRDSNFDPAPCISVFIGAEEALEDINMHRSTHLVSDDSEHESSMAAVEDEANNDLVPAHYSPDSP